MAEENIEYMSGEFQIKGRVFPEKKKGRAPLEALPCTAMLADLNFVA